jgi:hypothetical protein
MMGGKTPETCWALNKPAGFKGLNPLVYAVAWQEVRHTETLVSVLKSYVAERKT